MEKLCSKCGVNVANEVHECPYQAEINDDFNPEYCDCCDECMDMCRDEI